MSIFDRKKKPVELPAVLTKEEDPVNANSVLEYLTGLSQPEYAKLLKAVDIYREANKAAAKALGVKDEPVTTLKTDKPTDDEIEAGLDQALNQDFEPTGDLPEPPKPAKPQAPARKVEVK